MKDTTTLDWSKLSKGHYGATGPDEQTYMLDVYEPDGERYYWLVTRTNVSGICGDVAGCDHIADAKAAALRDAKGQKARKSERSRTASERPVIYEVSNLRAHGTMRPPKVAKPATMKAA